MHKSLAGQLQLEEDVATHPSWFSLKGERIWPQLERAQDKILNKRQTPKSMCFRSGSESGNIYACFKNNPFRTTGGLTSQNEDS